LTFGQPFLTQIQARILAGFPGPVALYMAAIVVAGGYLLGSVTIGNPRWYNVFFIGLAPLLLLPLAYLGLRWRLEHHPIFNAWEAGVVFLLANLVYASASCSCFSALIDGTR